MRKEANPDNVCVVNDAELAERLTPLQFAVTRKGATERPFDNAYWNTHGQGIYVDVVDNAPLFSSAAKYDSGTGWPSFWEPLDADNIELVEDRTHGMVRTEVRAKASGSHLGHVFDDGPEPTGLRYCMNSASLRFIPVSDLEAEGFAEYRKLFE